jgi:hypothetical protein
MRNPAASEGAGCVTMKSNNAFSFKNIVFAYFLPTFVSCVLSSCAIQSNIQKSPVSTGMLTEPLQTVEFQKLLSESEETKNWRYIFGQERFITYVKVGFFKNYVSNEIQVPPTLIAFKYYAPQLTFYIPFGKENGEVISGLSCFSFNKAGDNLAFVTFSKGPKEPPSHNLFIWKSKNPTPTFLRILPFNLQGGFNRPLTLSEDGKTVAVLYPSSSTTSQSILIVDVATKKETIVESDASSDLQWTPDRKLIYTGKIFKQTKGGIFEREIIEFDPVSKDKKNIGTGLNPSISPDGKWIVYAKPYYRSIAARMIAKPSIEAFYDLILYDRKTSESRTIVRYPRGLIAGNDLDLSSPFLWSPDSRFINFGRFSIVGELRGYILDTKSGAIYELGLNQVFDGWNIVSKDFEDKFPRKNSPEEKQINDLWKAYGSSILQMRH